MIAVQDSVRTGQEGDSGSFTQGRLLASHRQHQDSTVHRPLETHLPQLPEGSADQEEHRAGSIQHLSLRRSPLTVSAQAT